MNIVFFITSMRGGGAERIVANLCNELSTSQNRDITIITMNGTDSAYHLPKSVKIISLKSGVLSTGVGKVFSLPIASLELALLLKKIKPDATLSLLVRPNLIHVLTRWMGNSSNIYLSERLDTSHYYSKATLTNNVMKWLIKRLYPFSNRIIAISNGVKTGLIKMGVNDNIIRTIYNPQDIDYIQKSKMEKTDVNWNASIPTLVTVGRLDNQKDYFTLLDSFCIIKNAVDCRLLIIGEGPLEQELKKYCDNIGLSHTVEWLGWQPNPFSIMSKSDLFLFTPIYEGFGNVIVEAMICKLPVVVTDCPSGPAEILNDGEYGTLVPVGDCNAIANATIQLLENRTLYNNQVEQSQKRIQDFDVRIVSKKYLNALGLS